VKNLSKRSTLILVSFVALALVIAGGVFQYNHIQQREREQRQAALAADTQNFKVVMKQASGLRLQKRYAEANIVLKAYNSKALSVQNKTDALISTAINYEMIGDNKTAYATYLEAEKLSPKENYAIYFGAARSAETAADHGSALKYYQKCLKMLQALKPDDVNQSDIEMIMNDIKTQESKV
jgi:tetratricopeptide (TPR) repeat protein